MIRVKAKKFTHKSVKAVSESVSSEVSAEVSLKHSSISLEKIGTVKKGNMLKKKADDLPEMLKHEEAVKTLDQPKRRSRLFRVVRWVVGLSIVFVMGSAVAAYGFAWRSTVAMQIYRLLPFPAAMVEMRIVTLYQYYSYLDASEHYNQSEEGRNALFAFKPGELEHITLERLTDNALTLFALAKAKVVVTNEQLDAVIQQMSSVSSKEELENRPCGYGDGIWRSL